MEGTIQILTALSEMGIALVAVLTLAVVLYFLIKMVQSVTKTNETIREGMTQMVLEFKDMANAVNRSEEHDESFRTASLAILEAIKELVSKQTFVCEAQKYYEKLKKEVYYCPRKDEIEKLRKESQRGESKGGEGKRA